jgi:hypothetical protein
LGYAEFSSELQMREKPTLAETYRSSGAGTIQNKAPAEMQGLCCFWVSQEVNYGDQAGYKSRNASGC